MRSAPIVLFALGVTACDTMISDRIRITATPTATIAAPSTEEILGFVRDSLTTSALRRGPSVMKETWEWRDPDHPPGLHAVIEPAAGSVIVSLSQDLYGPIGETAKYRSVKQSLLDGAKRRFGSNSVQVK